MKKVSIEKFADRFEKEYRFCYENGDRVAGFDEAVDAFDAMLERDWFKRLVREFCGFRNDVISSDREAAAFAFAMEALGMLA